MLYTLKFPLFQDLDSRPTREERRRKGTNKIKEGSKRINGNPKTNKARKLTIVSLTATPTGLSNPSAKI